MTRLFVGNESIEIRFAIKIIKSKICLLKARIENIPVDCDIGQRLRLFYAEEISSYKETLKWLGKYESNH